MSVSFPNVLPKDYSTTTLPGTGSRRVTQKVGMCLISPVGPGIHHRSLWRAGPAVTRGLISVVMQFVTHPAAMVLRMFDMKGVISGLSIPVCDMT